MDGVVVWLMLLNCWLEAFCGALWSRVVSWVCIVGSSASQGGPGSVGLWLLHWTPIVCLCLLILLYGNSSTAPVINVQLIAVLFTLCYRWLSSVSPPPTITTPSLFDQIFSMLSHLRYHSHIHCISYSSVSRIWFLIACWLVEPLTENMEHVIKMGWMPWWYSL